MVLSTVPGQIHIAFDGWRSRNRHALYGVVCFYIDCNGAPSKLVLGLPELKISHSGENIAAKIMEILESYGHSREGWVYNAGKRCQYGHGHKRNCRRAGF